MIRHSLVRRGSRRAGLGQVRGAVRPGREGARVGFPRFGQRRDRRSTRFGPFDGRITTRLGHAQARHTHPVGSSDTLDAVAARFRTFCCGSVGSTTDRDALRRRQCRSRRRRSGQRRRRLCCPTGCRPRPAPPACDGSTVTRASKALHTSKRTANRRLIALRQAYGVGNTAQLVPFRSFGVIDSSDRRRL